MSLTPSQAIDYFFGGPGADDDSSNDADDGGDDVFNQGRPLLEDHEGDGDGRTQHGYNEDDDGEGEGEDGAPFEVMYYVEEEEVPDFIAYPCYGVFFLYLCFVTYVFGLYLSCVMTLEC